MPTPIDLTSIATADLKALLAALDAGRLTLPLSRARLVAAGLSVAADALIDNAIVDPNCLHAALTATLAERNRPGASTQLVWTGPEPTYSVTRETPRVLNELFSAATHRVVLAGFSFSHGDIHFAALHDAIRTRGVICDIFIDVDGDQYRVDPDDEERLVTETIHRFIAKNWPWAERPSFYYDPRRFDPKVYASIHAKCIVVDDQKAFVTSANFTDRGQNRNIEVGALIDDRHFAANLAGQFHRCARDGVFRKVPDAWLPAPPPEAAAP